MVYFQHKHFCQTAIIYFYSKKGNFKPANFYAIILLIRELKQKNRFNEFTDIRKDFEEFIYKNDYIFEQLNRNLRSTKKSSDGIKSMFLLIIDGLKKELSEKDIDGLRKIMEENKLALYS